MEAKAPDLLQVDNVALALNYRMPGVDYKPASETVAEFIMSTDLIAAAIKIITEPEKIKEIGAKVLANHNTNTRCFIFVLVTRTSDGKCEATNVFVFTWRVGSYLVGRDLRFAQYIQNYDMKWCIPIYVIHDKTESFHGGTIGQPWIPKEQLLNHLQRARVAESTRSL